MKIFAMVAAAGVLAACGVEATPVAKATPSKLATPSSTASPVPVIPATATIDAVSSWAAGTNDLGDPREILTLSLRTNIPDAVPYTYAFVMLLTPTGQLLGGCPSPDGVGPVCFLRPGREVSAKFMWPGVAPKGGYVLTLLIYSYQDVVAEQSYEYAKWVGLRGSALVGNPLAVKDDRHPAVLNLRRVIEISH